MERRGLHVSDSDRGGHHQNADFMGIWWDMTIFSFGYSLIPWAIHHRFFQFYCSNTASKPQGASMMDEGWGCHWADFTMNFSHFNGTILYALTTIGKNNKPSQNLGIFMVNWYNTGSYWQPLFNLSQQVGDSFVPSQNYFVSVVFGLVQQACAWNRVHQMRRAKDGLNRRCTFPLVLLGTNHV